MSDNTRNKTSAFLEAHNKCKSDCDCISHLKNSIHTAMACKQVYNMSHSECHSRYGFQLPGVLFDQLIGNAQTFQQYDFHF